MHKNASINTTGSIIISTVSNLYLGSFFIGALLEVADSVLTPAVEVLAVLFEPSVTLLPALVLAVLFEPSVTLLSEFIAVELSVKCSLILQTSFSFHQVHIPVYLPLGS